MFLNRKEDNIVEVCWPTVYICNFIGQRLSQVRSEKNVNTAVLEDSITEKKASRLIEDHLLRIFNDFKVGFQQQNRVRVIYQY